jgi:hypothetical protein
VEATRELYYMQNSSLITSKGVILSLQLSASSLEVDKGVKGISFIEVDYIAYS